MHALSGIRVLEWLAAGADVPCVPILAEARPARLLGQHTEEVLREVVYPLPRVRERRGQRVRRCSETPAAAHHR